MSTMTAKERLALYEEGYRAGFDAARAMFAPKGDNTIPGHEDCDVRYTPAGVVECLTHGCTIDGPTP